MMRLYISPTVTGTVLIALAVCGCSHRDAPTLTPNENSATPTYRSTTNSWEMDSAPKYTQSGINGGEPATVPAIPSPQRFSENVPLAFSAFGAIHSDPKVDSRYVSVYAKGSTIRLLGTADKSDIVRLLKDIKTVKGVKQVQNELQEK